MTKIDKSIKENKGNKKLERGFFGFWIRNLRTSFLLMTLIIVAGLFSLYSIPKESSPDIKFGIIGVSVSYPGVNPVDMDSLITEKIEQEIEDIDGIKKISSTSGVGFSSVTIELETGVDTRDLLTDIKDKVDKVELPEDATDPIVNEISTNNTLIYEALVYGDANTFSDFSLYQKAKKIKDKLEGNYGIADVEIGGLDSLQWGSKGSGDASYDIKVLLNKSKVEQLGLSIINIANIIKINNKDTPIGNYKVGDLNYDFRFEGELEDLEDLKNVVIRDNGYSKVILSDIADFKTKYPGDEIRRLGSYNLAGQNYISVVINKSSGANVFDASKASKEAFELLLKSDPDFKGLNILYSKDMSELIKEDYGNLSKTAMTTIVLVFITIMFFVGLREGIIASLLIPISFLVTFTVLDLLGLSLNFLTNFSLVLTLGIAIDTVIVIIEGASEKMKLGYTRRTAIMIAIRDFRSPLISGTFTTLAAFLPLMFLPGIMGKFLSYIPITVFSTLLAALILSLTLSSALFLVFMKPKKTYHKDSKIEKNLTKSDLELLFVDRENKTAREFDTLSLRERLLHGLGNLYEKLINKILHSTLLKIGFIFIPIILLVTSFLTLSPQIGFVLFPNTDEGVLTINITAESGVDEEYMSKYISNIDDSLSKVREVKNYYTTVNGNNVSVYIDMIDKSFRKENDLLSVYELEEIINNDLGVLESEGLEVLVATLANGPPTGSPVGVKISSNSADKFDTLKIVAEDFKEYLKTIPHSKNVTTSSNESPGQFIFSFDKNKLSNIGLNQNDILNELYFYTNGINAGSIKSGLEDNEIKISFKQFENSLSPEEVENIIVNTKIGKVRVGDFADFEFKKSVNAITREDGDIIISIGAEVEKGYLPTDVQPILDEYMNNYIFPDGITFIKGGETEENQELIVSTIKSLIISLFIIFSILVFQFNSFKQPSIVLYSIVLALLGVNVGLFLTGNPYSMPFAIGFIALTGIVVNDAIILIDKMNKIIRYKEEHTKSRVDYVNQIIAAGKSRLQPIIVTTLTTVFGVLPLALQDEFWAGLGFTIIFGLFVGSSMTLIAIPILYDVLVLGKKGREVKIKK